MLQVKSILLISTLLSNVLTAYTTVNESDIVSLNVQNASINEIYVGQNVTVTCTSSIHLFAKGMRILLLSTIDENGFSNTVVEG